MSYCSLAEAKTEVKATGTVDDDMMLRYIRQVSARIDRIMSPSRIRPIFEPYVEQRFIEIDPRIIQSGARNALFLPYPLLAFSSVLVDLTDVTASVEAYPQGVSPIRALRFTNSAYTWYDFCSSANDPVYAKVTGVWGFHADYANAWLHVDDVTLAVVTPSAVSMTAADVDGDDPYGIAPRFSPGQLLRVGGGAEIVYLSTVTPGSNTLTIKRAHNGSSAPAGNYAIGGDIDVFQVEEPIRRVVARQAALLYARQGAFEVQSLDGTGLTTYPQDLLVELTRTLTEYMYV